MHIVVLEVLESMSHFHTQNSSRMKVKTRTEPLANHKKGPYIDQVCNQKIAINNIYSLLSACIPQHHAKEPNHLLYQVLLLYHQGSSK
jgi:hypothetical protein